MNPVWNAAEALLALAQECLGADCANYPRKFVTTSQPVADCDTLAVVLGNLNSRGSSCVNRIQYPTSLEIHLIRCCEPAPSVGSGGYTPPTPEAVQAAAACVAKDAWRLLECVVCSSCDTVGAVRGVEACCNDQTPGPSVRWGGADTCRYAVISVPVTFTICCPVE